SVWVGLPSDPTEADERNLSRLFARASRPSILQVVSHALESAKSNDRRNGVGAANVSRRPVDLFLLRPTHNRVDRPELADEFVSIATEGWNELTIEDIRRIHEGANQ